ncbi:hypothetical protein BDR05DRAFT_742276 [Suillus weaverae]|nr:hypothetical protein BDR05DRAFT_742276 [Suillus weaverae]
MQGRRIDKTCKLVSVTHSLSFEKLPSTLSSYFLPRVPAYSMALKDSFAHTRVAGVIAFIATAECFETDDVAGKVVSAVVGATLARENDQAFKAVELFVKCLQAHAATMPETAATDDDGKDLSVRLPGCTASPLSSRISYPSLRRTR